MRRNDFPIFKNNDIVYLDSGATTQKPYEVIESQREYYENFNANPHRGAYKLSLESTKIYEEAKQKVAKFINAKNSNEIVFTRGTTESINLLAYSLKHLINKDDKIVISIMEHHSNLVPWQNIVKEKSAKLEYMYINENCEIDENEIENKIDENTKIVSIAHVSNVLGIKNNIEKIVKKAREVGAIIIVDAAQAVPHMKIDVKKLDVDFLAFSGHKMYAPMGIGVLYGKMDSLKKLKEFHFGGDMIEYVYEKESTYADIPERFEAGTQNVSGAYGLRRAIEYLESIGMDNVENYENELTKYAYEELKKLDFVVIYGCNNIENHSSTIAFNVKNVHSHDVSSILDTENICIRTGNHCAQPLHRYLNLNSTCRISFGIYNDKKDIDLLVRGLKKVYNIFEKQIRG